MSRTRRTSFVAVVLETMGWPVIWGLGICSLFYGLHFYGIFESALFDRYFATHPVQYVEMGLFCIGIAAITIKVLNVVGQFSTLDDIEMSPKPSGGQNVEDVSTMLGTLEQLPDYMRESYLARRLRQALEFVQRKGAAMGLDSELKHLSDLDAGRQFDGYGLVRVIIWATPMLGFLGTVIGITLALGDLSPQSLVSEPETAMQGLLGGLSVAFDTTALALMLAMILMFSQFLTSRLEAELIEAVDQRVSEYLVGRFQQYDGSEDPYLGAMTKMSQKIMSSVGEMLEANQKHVMENMEQLVERQVKLWKMTIDSASKSWSAAQREANDRFELAQAQWTASQDKWNSMSDAAEARITAMTEATSQRLTALTEVTSQKLSADLSQSLDESIRSQVANLGTAEDESSKRVAQHWDKLHSALTENARILATQQSEMARQGDALLDVVSRTGDLTQLQSSLNDNVNSLVISGKLDETVATLSGAINLLNARLTHSPTHHASVSQQGQPAQQMRVFRGPEREAA